MNTQDFCFILKQNSHLLREGCLGLEKEKVRVNQDGTLAPVSYTHLDVYKRQAALRSKRVLS